MRGVPAGPVLVLLTARCCSGPRRPPPAGGLAAGPCSPPCGSAAVWAPAAPGCLAPRTTRARRRCWRPRGPGDASSGRAATASSPGSSACCWPPTAARGPRPPRPPAGSSARPCRTLAGATWTGAGCRCPAPRSRLRRMGAACSLGQPQVTPARLAARAAGSLAAPRQILTARSPSPSGGRGEPEACRAALTLGSVCSSRHPPHAPRWPAAPQSRRRQARGTVASPGRGVPPSPGHCPAGSDAPSVAAACSGGGGCRGGCHGPGGLAALKVQRSPPRAVVSEHQSTASPLCHPWRGRGGQPQPSSPASALRVHLGPAPRSPGAPYSPARPGQAEGCVG